MTKLKSRNYGDSGPPVFLLHGGPGVSGHMAPVARELADSFRVIEPFQRRSGVEPLTVARHVADLHELTKSYGDNVKPALVGSSWGAMLALAYAAAHPKNTGPLVLIGCGTFDPAARAHLHATLDQRMDDDLRQQLERLQTDISNPDERFREMGNLLLPLYSFDLLTTDLEIETVDHKAHQETWDDMMRLQSEGMYPASFAAIESPALMLHGAVDPHPGIMIRDSLKPYVPQLEYREWERCGHYPWLERAVREEFFMVLREWLGRQVNV